MIAMGYSFSRRLALVLGILLPLAETIRRWGVWFEYPAGFLDDWIAGALLVYGGWRASKNAVDGQRYLVMGWAFACGLGYGSFFGNLRTIGEPDPAPISHAAVTAVIGIGWALCIVALIGALQQLSREAQST